ncbi:MAG: molybdopterin cofactor-binding domain-containing protein, partial [Pseudomonadota bacterium]
GHLPGPYSIPNVASNVYCVYTNRTPSTAMRGFGITGVDFAIECHMDKVAEAVGMDPIELRILNAYRDGDMKAHRRLAKNCALIESCQVAAQKAGWAISPEAAAQSSLAGGGDIRAAIPATVTDVAGKIGDRRQGSVPPEPFGGAAARGRLPDGHATGESVAGAPVQRDDMQIDASRIGHNTSPAASAPAAQLPPTPPTPLPSTGPIIPVPAPPPAAETASEEPAPSQPDKPFQRGVRRPGVSRFISGARRR